jgi:hypothetical protein
MKGELSSLCVYLKKYCAVRALTSRPPVSFMFIEAGMSLNTHARLVLMLIC